MSLAIPVSYPYSRYVNTRASHSLNIYDQIFSTFGEKTKKECLSIRYQPAIGSNRVNCRFTASLCQPQQEIKAVLILNVGTLERI